MRKCLLSVDWDYFVYTQKENRGSYIENSKNTVNLWYKRYLQSKIRGRDIQKSFKISPATGTFWEKIKEHFQFTKGIKAYVSDSHALSYDIAKQNNCKKVFLFDAHADLGYGDISSLNFEVNCANWLGKLLKDGQIEEASIIYSPHTDEKPEYFNSMNNIYKIRYPSLDDLETGIKVSAVHICRSGAWTPPWLDEKFAEFVKSSGIPCEIIDCPQRKWDTEKISFSDAIYYMMA
mgnify:CR=1 FL=1